MEDNSYTDYGYVNGWAVVPEEVRNCEKSGHRMFVRNISNCLTEYGCEVCRFKFRVDSSD